MIDYLNENKIDDDIILCYLNADIILTESFTELIKTLNNNTMLESSLIVGKRNEWHTPENLNLEKNNSLNLELIFKNLNNKVDDTAHDYFIFNKKFDFLKQCMNKESGLGEPCYDIYIVGTFLYNNKIVIDATDCINAIHQDHGKFNEGNLNNKLDISWNKNSVKLNLQNKNFKLKEVELYDKLYDSSINNIRFKILLNFRLFNRIFIEDEPIKAKPIKDKIHENPLKRKKIFKIFTNLILIYFIKNTNFIMNLMDIFFPFIPYIYYYDSIIYPLLFFYFLINF
jgi:hypothetical protein